MSLPSPVNRSTLNRGSRRRFDTRDLDISSVEVARKPSSASDHSKTLQVKETDPRMTIVQSWSKTSSHGLGAGSTVTRRVDQRSHYLCQDILFHDEGLSGTAMAGERVILLEFCYVH